jgi:hypothetical protein
LNQSRVAVWMAGVGAVPHVMPPVWRANAVRRVDEQLRLRRPVPSQLALEVLRNDQRGARAAGGQYRLRLRGHGQRHHAKGERGAKRVRVLPRQRRLIEILDDDRDVGDRQRDRRAHERGEGNRQHQRQPERETVA